MLQFTGSLFKHTSVSINVRVQNFLFKGLITSFTIYSNFTVHIICNFEALHKIFIPCLDVAATFVIRVLFLLIINQTCRGDWFFVHLAKIFVIKLSLLRILLTAHQQHQASNYKENSHIKSISYYSMVVFKVSWSPPGLPLDFGFA